MNTITSINRRLALASWNHAVSVYRHSSGTDMYSESLQLLDAAWRAAALPLPWYPSMIAVGADETRTAS